MLERQDKERIVQGLKSDLDAAKALFLTNLIGIPANDAVRIRKEVREAKGKLVITRNSLFARAAKGTYAESLLADLKGPTAVAFAYEEAPAVAKALYEANKELELVELRSGLFDGKELSPEEIKGLAKLPSRNEMLGTLLATFNAPISAFARVMHQVKEQKEAGGGAAAEAAPEAETAAEKPEE